MDDNRRCGGNCFHASKLIPYGDDNHQEGIGTGCQHGEGRCKFYRIWNTNRLFDFPVVTGSRSNDINREGRGLRTENNTRFQEAKIEQRRRKAS